VLADRPIAPAQFDVRAQGATLILSAFFLFRPDPLGYDLPASAMLASQ
jgi:hypothetical protein